MSDQNSPESVKPKTAEFPRWEHVNPEALNKLVAATLQETVYQKLSAIKVWSDYLEMDDPKFKNHKEQAMKEIGPVADEGLKMTRALQKAINLGGNGEPIPIKDLADGPIIDLQELVKIQSQLKT